MPVLAIPPSLRLGRAGRELDITRVIAPINLAGEWQSDAVRAAEIAGEFDAQLMLVHVLAPVQTPPWFGRDGRASEQRRIDNAKRALERVRTRVFSDLRALSTVVVVGDPADEIARLTRRPGSLVSMSLRGTAGSWG